MANMLSRQGYRLHRAVNGPEALNIVGSHPVDLVLLDIVMPAMNGYEVCRRLKQNRATCKIPVLFLTALTDDEDKLKGFRIGAVDYITKPFNPCVVAARVKVHLTIDELRCQLKNESQRFRNLAEATFEALIIHINGQIVEMNRNLVDLTGFRREQLLACKIETLLALNLQSHVCGDDGYKAKQTGPRAIIEGEIKTQSGRRVAVEMLRREIKWQDHCAQVIALRDITWRKTLVQKAFQLESENRKLKASLSHRNRLGGLVGHSLAMRKVYAGLIDIANSDETVIIYGETGSGKELAAQTIFQLSRRHGKAFIPVNCSAIPKNLFESEFFGYVKGAFTGADRDMPGHFDKAHGGVLFLDEITELRLADQAKLLRVLNDKSYTPIGASTPRKADVRIIAAATHKLKELVEKGLMRSDFFFRIHVLTLEMPPLRKHKDDIPLLVQHFIARQTPDGKKTLSISKGIQDILLDYHWPGNVRELFNELRRFLFSGKIELDGAADTPSEPRKQDAAKPEPNASFNDKIAAYEKCLIQEALQKTGGNIKAAAEWLQIPLATMHRKIKRFGLNASKNRS